MSWPVLSQLVKGLDASCYQNPRNSYTDRENGQIDFVELASEHPEVLVMISRVAGSWSGVDPDFHHNFTESVAAGYHAGAYVNVNPKKSVDRMMADWWKPQIDAATGGRDPKLIVIDAETNGWYSSQDHQWHDKVSAATCTTHVQTCLSAVAEEWPTSTIWIYTAAWWWNGNIVHGWEGAYWFWVAHYAYFSQDSRGEWIKPVGFAEVDRNLPIGNSFTPKLPTGIDIGRVVGWQFTDTGILRPIQTNADLDYFKRSEIDRIWDSGTSAPAPQPIDITQQLADLRAAGDDILRTADELEAKIGG